MKNGASSVLNESAGKTPGTDLVALGMTPVKDLNRVLYRDFLPFTARYHQLALHSRLGFRQQVDKKQR